MESPEDARRPVAAWASDVPLAHDRSRSSTWASTSPIPGRIPAGGATGAIAGSALFAGRYGAVVLCGTTGGNGRRRREVTTLKAVATGTVGVRLGPPTRKQRGEDTCSAELH